MRIHIIYYNYVKIMQYELESVAKPSVIVALRSFTDAELLMATWENIVTMTTGVGRGPM